MKRPEDIFFEGLGGLEKKAEEPPKIDIKISPPSAPKPLTSKSLFSHPDAHPVVLDLVLLKYFQLDWLSWLPETLFSEIESVFKTSVAEVNKLKIMATKTLHVVDAFWTQWEIFEKSIAALNGIVPRLRVIQPPDLPSLFAGVDIASGIREEVYGDEVSRYCAAVFLHENVQYAPEPLSFCQPFITQPTYHCKDCGKNGSALPPFDGLCSSCGGHYDKEHALNFKPNHEVVARGFGRNITLGVTYDPLPIKLRFEELDSLPHDMLADSITETSDDIQAAKLITAIDFKNFRAQQLKQQLESIRGWLEMS